MNKVERIYLHKEDVWAEGDHWMSSASRDVFEHFYKAIRNTFLDRYQDSKVLELAEQIVHQRKWETFCYGLISDAAKNKTMPALPPYLVGRDKFPLEMEYNQNKEGVIQTEQDFDPVVYSSFELFFSSANHGYGQDEESKKIVYDLYFNFMKPYSKEQLAAQKEVEYQESLSFLNEMIKDLKEFNKQTDYSNFNKFIFRNK